MHLAQILMSRAQSIERSFVSDNGNKVACSKHDALSNDKLVLGPGEAVVAFSMIWKVRHRRVQGVNISLI
jgi:hypothetical protein